MDLTCFEEVVYIVKKLKHASKCLLVDLHTGFQAKPGLCINLLAAPHLERNTTDT